MELSRFLRALHDRWRTVVVIAVLGTALAVIFTLVRNRNITPVFEATAPIRFEPAEGETIADLENDLEEALRQAVFAAQEELTADPSLVIQSDTASGRLLFIATGPTTEAASERARELRQLYLDVEPTVGGRVDDLLAQIERQAEELQTELARLQPPLNQAQRDLIDRYDLIDAQIQAFRSRLVQLNVEVVTAPADDRPDLEAAVASVEAELARLEAERASLPPRPDEQVPIDRQLQADAVTRRLELLGQEYERLYLRKLGVTGGGVAEPVAFRDLTPTPMSPALNGLIGLVGSVLLAGAALMIDTRMRRPVWLASDVPLPILAEIPFRPPSATPGILWYDTARHPRKPAIQVLRTTVEGRLRDRPATLALSGYSTAPGTVHVLAADLAAAFANAGWSVLVVDADLESPSGTGEFKVDGPGLAEVLAVRGDDVDNQWNAAKKTLDEAVWLRDDLALVPAGSQVDSPADLLAGRQLRVFLDEAVGRFDLVVVVAGSADSPAGQVLLQRLDGGLLVIEPGRVTVPELEDVAAALQQGGVRLLGSVLVSRFGGRAASSRRRGPSETREPRHVTPVTAGEDPRSREAPTAGVAEETPSSAPPGRDEHEPDLRPARSEAGGARAAAVEKLRPEALRGDAAEHLGEKVLEALTDADPAEGYEMVAEFVVAKVEDILLANHGSVGVSEETVEVMIRTGFAPLRSVKGYPSVGARIAAELRHQLGNRLGHLVEQQIRRILSGGRDDGNLDDWLAAEFFPRHLVRTDRQPTVWHLRSRLGVVQVLVNARRFDRERLDLLVGSLIRTVADSLQRQRRSTARKGPAEAVDRLDRQLEDVNQMAIALGWLYEGTTPEARIVYPWREQQPKGWNPVWSEGIMANLAPLQRLGLLAVPVLTDEELFHFRP